MTIVTEAFGSTTARVVMGRRGEDVLALPAPELRDLFRVAGLVLFRGFHGTPLKLFGLAQQFSVRFNRDRLRPVVEGTNGYVQQVTEGMGYVEAHAEQGNSPFRPDAVWFCCLRPAAEAGETLAWDGIELWKRLDPDLKALFRAKKIRFFQRYDADKWRRFVGDGASITDARRILDRVEGVNYFVQADESIYVEYLCSAVVRTRFGQQEAFTNSLLSERRNTLGEAMAFDDGTPIDDDIIDAIRRVMRDMTDAIKWEAGDLAFVDNSHFLHGRNAYTDPGRQLFSSMSYLAF